ncbi:hypothetical protein KXR64_20140 [Brucella intermedia]|uniref:hypothetical protein n=1 Tax=Brucella TaxID=234 RepID=UPI00094674EB|nr:hypothetical protein [Brucella intermedia]
MKNHLLKCLLSVCSLIPSYLISSSNVRADEWGCKVILCLSNPGGATQYAECRPPIHKLWRELARGHSFPTCSAVGFRSSRPGYDPYYCSEGYKLSGGFGSRGEQVTCVSNSLHRVSRSMCSMDPDNRYSQSGSVLSARWEHRDGRRECMGYPITRPKVRERPHYLDISIDGVGKQRVWY